jgi:general L-amino acid transport system permease protein
MAPENTPSDAIQFHSQVPLWRDERVLRIATQVISAIVVIGLLFWGITNVINAAEDRGLSLGFDFLQESAGFPS